MFGDVLAASVKLPFRQAFAATIIYT